jgi:protein-tyrosine phosphatase
MKILMVCLGNICRSPIAEGVLQHKAQKAGLNWIVESAGTNGYHNGEAPHHLSQKITISKGIDISHQRSRQFKKSDFFNYDLIYAMASDVMSDMKFIGGNEYDNEKTFLFLDELFPGEAKDVPDPWYGEEDGYVEVYDLIDKACEEIIKKYFKK